MMSPLVTPVIRLTGARLLLACVLVVLAAWSPAEAGLADRVGATFALMADDFVKAFEPLQGIVVAVDGEAIYLDLGEDSGVQAGQEFTVFRRGDAFRHPI